ncbi:hypothetical protein [Pseudorhodoplanes sp.]|uniref:hypothetical protein n=1 Tax=Pseudorhodoplanes sp. TaxID=1934341 RepID=UPI003D0E8AA8
MNKAGRSAVDRKLLLVGSVPLDNSAAVFQMLAHHLGDHLTRVPDGETGSRRYWIHCQNRVLEGNPHFEPVEREVDVRDRRKDGTRPPPRFSIRSSLAEAKIGALGYAQWAIESYATLRELKRDAKVPRGWKLQVGLPTPHAFVQHLIVVGQQAEVEAVYEARMREEVRTILAAIPGDELAIQWDVASEFASIEGVRPHYYANVWDDIVERLARLGEMIPAGVELGYHLCYGDLGHRHFAEPTDAGNLTRLMNRVSASVHRTIDWFHIPVPRDRTDSAYYAPLRDLRLQVNTDLYLGLIHLTDGEEGCRRRIAAAEAVCRNFGLATECGFGRRSPSTIPQILDLHRRLAMPAEIGAERA